MVGLVFYKVYHLMGFLAGLKGFTAAVVGGIGSIPGAMLGGLLIGLSEAFITGYVSSTFQDVFVFSILIVAAARPAERPAGKGGHPEGMSAMSDSRGNTAEGPKIGVDEWVARSEERTGVRGGRLAPLYARAERLPWWVLLVAAVGVSALLPFVSSSEYVIRVAVNTVLFALLALGLNVVVGWAGPARPRLRRVLRLRRLPLRAALVVAVRPRTFRRCSRSRS